MLCNLGIKNLIDNKGALGIDAVILIARSALAVAAFIGLFMFLPDSPFTLFYYTLPEGWREMMSYVSYYVPFAEIISMGITWVFAMVGWYMIKMSMKVARSQI
jgi:hypothetical protein